MAKQRITLISWNVNGIRAVVRKGFGAWLKKEQSDILGLQEIKITDAAREEAKFDFPNYQEFWNPAERPGYSGTATLISNKYKVAGYKAGLDGDREGRVQTVEFDKFYFVNVYFPNAKDDLSRIPFKQKFNAAILKHIKKLEKKKPVVICGDYNVAHQPMDLARPKENEGKKGFTKEERADFDQFVKHGLVDTFRDLYPDKIQYSWWSHFANARARNIGWRIDYFLVSAKLKKNVKDVFILDKIIGSDHAPVGLVIEL